MAHRAWFVALPRLWSSGVRDSGIGFRRQSQAAAFVVPCHVADDGAEDRAECQEPVRHLRIRQLSDRLGVAAKASERDGEKRTGAADGARRD